MNQSSKRSLLSPGTMVLLCVAAVALIILVVVLQQSSSLQARRPPATSTPTAPPQTEHCMCQCVSGFGTLSEKWLCPVKPSSGETQCSDEFYEFTDITEE